ncbi:hypothetical protein ACQPZP_39895 [Spirillospora sp. CA-142024]|uniref:hypothetical protein n=1 Tax=Spirillospora sp. CA-142024 TaxID=3240036 RepID=UPI003D92BEE0
MWSLVAVAVVLAVRRCRVRGLSRRQGVLLTLAAVVILISVLFGVVIFRERLRP